MGKRGSSEVRENYRAFMVVAFCVQDLAGEQVDGRV